ncbi:hypothetical protein EIP91_006667 [Steccherinum ochraceum]|uniref:Uncharacterized protein n=1 Tax=Steccherinum ochraceum TaxID=92696 RepID=A0A4R0RLP6_9APHY|nr:hypothetical protein EIP91_006667 [Steccherinum ochraceum]
MSDAVSEAKLPLPQFLQVLTSNNVPASKAIAVAAKIYKSYNTRSALGQLNNLKLKSAGVTDKEERKLVLAAIKKAGYNTPAANAAGTSSASESAPATTRSPARRKTGVNHSGTTQPQSGEPGKRKRKRNDDLNDLLPDHNPDDGESYGSLDFNEILDEEVLMSKYTTINRAPIMTAWSFIVAERLGFQREEALSIASVYTEMNAISKGVSIGIYDKGKGKGVEATRGGSQPYVDLMGRRKILIGFLIHNSGCQWRALSSGTPVSPSAAFSYITRTLKQTAPQIVGALRLLGASYSPAELNRTGYAMYAEFRPEVDGWGKRSELKCSTILGLRKKVEDKAAESGLQEADGGEGRQVDKIVKVDAVPEDDKTEGEAEEPDHKKARGMTLEEYEAALDADDTFNDLGWDTPDNIPTEGTSGTTAQTDTT